MKKTLCIPLLLACACSGSLPEDEVQNIFSRHSCDLVEPARLAAALKDGAAGLAALDPRAAVLKEQVPLKARPAGKSISSGLLLGEKNGEFYLLKVFAGSPAAAAGLREGDKVLAIDGGAPTAEALISGLGRSTRFTLRVERNGSARPEAEVWREAIFFPQVFSFYDPASRTAFLRVGLFYQGSGAEALAALAAAVRPGAERIVIDLRDNQGGVPAEAAELLKAFAPKPGPVLELRSRQPGYSAAYSAPARGRYAGLPLRLLVNGGTGMAAEVFAQSLRELAGARLAGLPTAGGVSLTRTFSLSDGRGLRLTIARLLPPSGAVLEGKGAQPDDRAGEPGGMPVWDDSREAALLGDPALAAALR